LKQLIQEIRESLEGFAGSEKKLEFGTKN